MGLILDTNDPVLGLEERRESFNVLDLTRKYPNETGKTYYCQRINTESKHIFANADGEIEVSKDFLRRLIAFFDDPDNRKRLEEGYGHVQVQG